MAPTTGTQARWHAEAIAQTPAATMDQVALSVPATTSEPGTTISNTARATAVTWRPAALTVATGSGTLPAAALAGTALSYGLASAGACLSVTARWMAGADLTIIPAAGASRSETLAPGASTALCLSIQPGAELLARYPGQTLTLTTGIEARAAEPATWTAPLATWTTTFHVPAAALTPPGLSACNVKSPNEKTAEISWTWTGQAKGWDVLQRKGSEWVSLGKDQDPSGNHPKVPPGQLLPGDRRSTTIRPAENSAEDVKVRVYVTDTVFVDSTQVFTFTAKHPRNEKVVCEGLDWATADPAAADVAPADAASTSGPVVASTAPSASATPAPAATAAPAPTPAPSATATTTTLTLPATATDATTVPATEGK
ncbi:hypothetical protein [Georgenia ruanii]